jgi:ribonuclease BN (tRNA processing enzyme)
VELVVLGGSAAGGNTGAGCAGYLVRSEQATIVLDLGPGTLLELRRHADFRRLDAVVISHLHVDHMLDLLALRYALMYNPIKPPGRIPLWMPPGGRAMLRRIATALELHQDEGDFFEASLEVRDYDPAESLTICDMTLRFAPTVHYIPCWASRISFGDASEDFVYTADMGPTSNLAPFVEGASVLVAESTLPSPAKLPPDERGHQTAREAAKLAAAADVDLLVLTHVWEEYGFDAYLVDAKSAFSGVIELAKPGLKVTWPLADYPAES